MTRRTLLVHCLPSTSGCEPLAKPDAKVIFVSIQEVKLRQGE